MLGREKERGSEASGLRVLGKSQKIAYIGRNLKYVSSTLRPPTVGGGTLRAFRLAREMVKWVAKLGGWESLKNQEKI